MLHPTQRNKTKAIVMSLMFWGILTWLDYAMGLRVRFGPAYAFPVLLITWYFGRSWGLLSALISALLWHGMQMVVLQDYSITFYRYWDLLSGLLAFLAVALAASWSRGMYLRASLLNEELQLALEKVRTLEGMLPICAWCRKVRDEQGQWEQIETYVAKHSDTTWTHGICPECSQRFKEYDST
ncbi:MAG: hypothetical protein U0P46_11280 [Holophagaceae bacterium]